METVDKKDKKFEKLLNSWQELSYNSAVISAAIEYSKSKETIAKKVQNENVAITYGINAINKKVLKHPQKYNNIENDFKELMDRYEKNLIRLTNYHDSNIVQGYIKIVEEEKRQIKMYKKIYQLIKEENVAKEKVDNSDDEIREKICDVEDEIAKSELKIRRLKPTIKKKCEEKEIIVNKAMESETQEIQREIKGPRAFSRATKFFLGKINPYKIIQKNIFLNVENRIEKFEQSSIVREANKKYLSGNLIETLNGIENNKKE